MPPALRYAYDTNGFAHHRLEDAIAILRACGYDGIGLTLDVHHLDPFRATPADLASWRSTLAGLEVVIQTGARFLLDPWRKHEPTLLAADERERARRFDFLARSIDVGAALGATAVSFWSGKRPEGATDDVLEARLADGVRRLCDHAERSGVALAFEPEPGMWIETLAGYRALRDAVNRPSFGLALDVGHLVVTGEPLDAALDEFARDLRVVQIEDIRDRVHEHRMVGEGQIDFRSVLASFARVGYRGLLELELSRDSHRAPDCARRALAYLREREPLGSSREP